MAVPADFAPGHHVVQFYEGEEFLARSVAAFCCEGLRRGDPVLLVSEPQSFDRVARYLTAQETGLAPDAASRIQFVDVRSALQQVMSADSVDPVRLQSALVEMFNTARRGRPGATVWASGEMVDLLCRQQNHAAALRLEELWNAISAAHQPVAVLCSCAVANFDDDSSGSLLRSVCRHHTHVAPAYGTSEGCGDRARAEEMVLLQRRARMSARAAAQDALGHLATARSSTPTVYVIDDHLSVRRSLERALVSVGLAVRTFACAEDFLAEVDASAHGCLIVDVQLPGMRGPELQRLLVEAGWTLPIIAMSASHDLQVERTAQRHGARVFLQKPFPAKALFDAIEDALK
jgi:CheY-like chemotaxis protein